jgi:hypothetical protein
MVLSETPEAENTPGSAVGRDGILGDGAGQFDVLVTIACWIHAQGRLIVGPGEGLARKGWPGTFVRDK